MHYTELNIEAINEITRQYDIGEVVSHKVLSGGSENTNYMIISNTASYVLTICEQKSKEEAINLALLLEHLANNNFSTSKIIRNKKYEPISIYDNKPVLLKTFIEGVVMNDLSCNLIELIGIQLGKLHKINAPEYLPKILNYGRSHFKDVAIYAKDSPFDNWLKKILNYITPSITEDIPKALIHSDVFFSNVIIKNDEPSVQIMDFEEATFYYRIFDIGMAIVGLCSEGEKINPNKVSNLLKGYVQEIDLTKSEQNALQPFSIYAAASMSFWRHQNFNYINPIAKMKNHYLELKNIADYLKNLPPHCFKDLLKNLT